MNLHILVIHFFSKGLSCYKEVQDNMAKEIMYDIKILSPNIWKIIVITSKSQMYKLKKQTGLSLKTGITTHKLKVVININLFSLDFSFIHSYYGLGL